MQEGLDQPPTRNLKYVLLYLLLRVSLSVLRCAALCCAVSHGLEQAPAAASSDAKGKGKGKGKRKQRGAGGGAASKKRSNPNVGSGSGEFSL